MTGRLGRYETLRAIASGGMATVHLGRVVGEGGFERLVALKVMHAHLARDPEFVAMFLDEARLAARIRHPNVVATIDIQKNDEAIFLVMDYIDGPSLHQLRRFLRRQRRTLPIDVTVRVLLDALAGLQAAHDLTDNDGKSLNLVHRDVSPQNVLIGTDGVARLTDFGVARAEARIQTTRGGQLKGKMAYMAPEQILAEGLDRRADVYAAGVVLWEALVGKRLFRAPNDGALVHMVLAGATTPPGEANDSVPEPISAVCMRALQRDRGERFACAEDFADALEDAARASGVGVARARLVGRLMRELLPQLPEPSDAGVSATGSAVDHLAGAHRSSAATPPSLPSDPSLASAPAVDSGISVASMPGGPSHSTATAAGAVLSMAPPRRRRGLIAAVGAGGVLLIGAVALLTTGGESHPAGTGDGTTPTANATPPPASSPAEATRPPTPPTASKAPSSKTATTSAKPAKSAPAQTSTTTKTHAPRPHSTQPHSTHRRPAHTGHGTKPSGTTYKPRRL